MLWDSGVGVYKVQTREMILNSKYPGSTLGLSAMLGFHGYSAFFSFSLIFLSHASSLLI
jgi:hypothetical protein